MVCLAAMSACRAAISARLSRKILTVGASRMVMAIMTTPRASSRPENALAGTGSRDSSGPPAAVRSGVLPPVFPPAFPAGRVAGFAGAPAVAAAVRGLAGEAAPEPPGAGLPVGADARGEAGAAPAGVAAAPLRAPPKSAWMTSPPSAAAPRPVAAALAAAALAAGVARGTLGRRVAMSLLQKRTKNRTGGHGLSTIATGHRFSRLTSL